MSSASNFSAADREVIIRRELEAREFDACLPAGSEKRRDLPGARAQAERSDRNLLAALPDRVHQAEPLALYWEIANEQVAGFYF